MSAVSPARKAAFQILLTLERGQAHSDDLLRWKSVSALASVDRNLATTLVLGVLRWQLALDQRLQAHLKRPHAKLDSEVRIALRLGAFQLLHLDRIPARAAIDESVELTKQAGHRFASGMVNAVLRKLASEAQQARESAEPTSVVSEAAAYPAWMIARWRAFFGEETACTICHHGQHQAELSVRLVDPAAEDELVQSGIKLAPGRLLGSARVVLSGDLTSTPALREGRVRIQDEGSQLVAEIAGQGSEILDCCAAPGGKTLILAERNPLAHIVACEASVPRLEALRNRLDHCGDRVESRLADATALEEQSRYDLVLADVPCSGTGTLGRNPEIRLRLAEEDFLRQAERQRRILSSAVRAARPGGHSVYSTCSLEPEENEQVVSAVLSEHREALIVPMEARIEELASAGILASEGEQALRRCITPEGFLRLFPGVVGTDGFFVAMLRKKA